MVTFIMLLLSIIGTINWLLVGLFEIDLIVLIFGSMAAVGARIVYTIIGISALWLIGYLIGNRGRINAKV